MQMTANTLARAMRVVKHVRAGTGGKSRSFGWRGVMKSDTCFATLLSGRGDPNLARNPKGGDVAEALDGCPG